MYSNPVRFCVLVSIALFTYISLLPVVTPARASIRIRTASQEWHTQTIAHNLSSAATFDMVESPSGSPHFLYNDSGRATVGAGDGNAWQGTQLTTGPTDPRFVSLRYDETGTAHVALYEGNALVYGVYEGNVWAWTVVDDSGAGEYPTLIVGQGGTPLISYWDSINYQVKVAALINGKWSSTTHISPAPLDAASGFPHGNYGGDAGVWVSYYDAPNTDIRLAHALYKEGAWIWTDTLIGSTKGDAGPAHALVASPEAVAPLLVYAYRDSVGELSLQQAVFDKDGGWISSELQALPDATAVPALSVAVASGNPKAPRVAYFLQRAEDAKPELWFAWNDSTTWQSATFGSVSVDLDYPVPPLLSANAQDRIAYLDGATLKMLTHVAPEYLP